MEKLTMCRVCLAGNVRMYVVVNKKLRDLYEKLTDNPFVTEDSRPMLVCFFCCTKLKQCYQFQRKCLEAEELFAQMMNGDYEPKTFRNQHHPEFCNGFVQSPIEYITIVDECKTENNTIKEEPTCWATHSEEFELELKKQGNRFLAVEDIPGHYSKAGDEILTEFKIEVEEHEVLRTKPKLDDVIQEEQKMNELSDTKVNRTTENCSFNTVIKFREPLTDTKRGVDNFSLDTNCRNKAEIKCVKSNKVIVRDSIKRRRRKRVIEESFKCDICQRSFNRKSVTRHARTHTGEKPFKCDVCQRCFSEKSNLTRHIRIHAAEKPYKCDICQRRFNLKSYLTAHIRIHAAEKPFKCDICQRRFNVKGNLTAHIRLHAAEKPYKCDICQRRFNVKGNLTAHIRIHAAEKPYKCDICHCCFNFKGSLKGHIRRHAGEYPFKCDVCQLSFSDKNHLTTHIRIHTELELKKQGSRFSAVEDIPEHYSKSGDEILTEFKIEVEEHEVLRTKPKLDDVIQEEQKMNELSDTKVNRTTENCSFNTVIKFREPLTDTKRGVDNFSLDTNCRNKAEIKCVKSNKVIVSDSIKRRRRKRVIEESFKCDICQRSFSRRMDLTRHIRTHTGEKPFKCDVCQRCFSEKSNLKKHIRIHTAEKPYKCDICQRLFNVKGNLTAHIRTHAAEKPYKCDICQRRFNFKGNLKGHIRIHAAEKPYKCDICQRRFNFKGNLKGHIRRHAGEYPFKCNVCQRRFSEKYNLTTHICIHTGEKP